MIIGLLVITFILSLILASKTFAHCDTLDGPVISAAKKALDLKNPNFVLIWVKTEDEETVKDAFKKALEKREKAINKEEIEQAEMDFFGLLVRIHREGEGASYEGIKPVGQVEKEILMADEAVESGNLTPVLEQITSLKNKQLIQQVFQTLLEKKNYPLEDLDKGREYVKTYVEFLHTTEKAIKN